MSPTASSLTGSSRLDRLVLLGVFGVVAAAALVWVAIDRRPPEWDHANHLERALLGARDLRGGDVRAILDRSSFYPPLVLCPTGAVSLVLRVEAAAVVVMLAFLGLGMVAVSRLGREVAGGGVGATAALLFATAPFLLYLALRLQLDLPLAAMVALSLATLLATEGFTRPWPSLVCGIVGGLGMLTKPTFALYVLPAATLLLLRAPRQGLPGAGLALLAAGGLSAAWYGPRAFGLLAQFDARAFAQAAESGHPDPLSLAGLAFYPRWLAYEIGLGAAALAAVGTVVALVHRQWFLLVAFAGPFVVLELARNKNLRYLLPLLAALAVLAALGLDALPGRPRRLIAAGLILLALMQVSAVTAGVPANLWLSGIDVWWVPASPPSRADWRHDEILSLLERDRGQAPATVSVVPNFARFSVSNFRLYAVRDGLGLGFVRTWDDPPIGIDYMILKSGDQGPVWTAEKSRRAAERLATDPHLARVFPVIGEYGLPDGSTATVRARRVTAVTEVSPGELGAQVEAGLRGRLADFVRDAEGLSIRLVHDDTIRSGRIRRAEIQAATATLGEYARPDRPRLRVRDVALVLDDVLVNPWSAAAEGRFDPLDIGRVRVQTATVSVADLQAFVVGFKRFRRTRIAVDGDALAVTVSQLGPDVSARVRMLAAADRPFTLQAERVRVAGIPVPEALVNWVIRSLDPTPRLASRARFPVEIGTVTVGGDALRIAGDRQ